MNAYPIDECLIAFPIKDQTMGQKKLFLWLMLFSLVFSTPAHAMRMPCYGQRNGIEDYDVIFKGRVAQDENLQVDRSAARNSVETPVYTTTFDVQDVYKGEVA